MAFPEPAVVQRRGGEEAWPAVNRQLNVTRSSVLEPSLQDQSAMRASVSWPVGTPGALMLSSSSPPCVCVSGTRDCLQSRDTHTHMCTCWFLYRSAGRVT